MPARILLTGATGMVGRFVTRALVEAGYSVRCQYLRNAGGVTGVEWRRWDFLENVNPRPLVEGCDGIIHLAAELNDVGKMERVNVGATRTLAVAAEAEGVRYFGHASSIVVYGSPCSRFVDEETPLIVPSQPMGRQYYADLNMLEYARTKTLGELALRHLSPNMRIDLLRPAVVANRDRLLASAGWSLARKSLALYRRTQYVYAPDVADAVVHLLAQGLKGSRRGVIAYNIADDSSGTYRELHARAYEVTGDPRFKVVFDVPVVADITRDYLRHRTFQFRYPLGMLTISNARLRATGYRFRTGFDAALGLALAAK